MRDKGDITQLFPWFMLIPSYLLWNRSLGMDKGAGWEEVLGFE